jgi:transposase
LVEPMIPPAKRGGRRREVNVREVLNAIFYVLSTGCQWQALPQDLPPKSTPVLDSVIQSWRGGRSQHQGFRPCAAFAP